MDGTLHTDFRKIYTTFKDVQMMLINFFDISTGFRFSKISVDCSVHLCSCPWLNSRLYGILKKIYILVQCVVVAALYLAN